MLIHHSGLLGGAGISLINNIKALAEENEVCVYLPSDPPDLKELLKRECPGVRAIAYGRRIGALTYYSGGDSPRKLRFWYRLMLIVKQWRYWNTVIEKENPDAVAVNSMILCWMSKLPAVRSRKSICFVRETKTGNPDNRLNRYIHTALERFSDVVFISKYDRDREALKTANAEVIYNYIDPTRLDSMVGREEAEKQLHLKEGVFRVLYVGGVVRMKGFDLAVRTVLESRHPMELLAAGIGFDDAMNAKSEEVRRYVGEMKTLLEREDPEHRVRMLGKQGNMSACYAACDVLVFPMRSPHQARPAFEAGFFGKPVIISDFENIREFVSDGVNGLLVEPDRADSLRQKIEYLYENREAAIRMGENNRERCLSCHSMEQNSRKITEIIRKTAKE